MMISILKIVTKTILAIAIITLLILFAPLPIFVNFTNKVFVKFHYGEKKKIDNVITDKNDIYELKRLFDGNIGLATGLTEVPSCGFNEGISLTFQTGVTKVILYPGCDTCGKFRIGKSNRYIVLNEQKKARFYEIIKKYGMTFPCV